MSDSERRLNNYTLTASSIIADVNSPDSQMLNNERYAKISSRERARACPESLEGVRVKISPKTYTKSAESLGLKSRGRSP